MANSSSSFVIDLTAILGLVAIGLVMIMQLSTNPGLINNSNYNTVVDEIVLAIASVISYSIGKNRPSSG